MAISFAPRHCDRNAVQESEPPVEFRGVGSTAGDHLKSPDAQSGEDVRVDLEPVFIQQLTQSGARFLSGRFALTDAIEDGVDDHQARFTYKPFGPPRVNLSGYA
ncbi:hypothetical protein HOU00_gp193 [Caulobacter phage CcrPW]|uniref:Uncharacterized protein n=1 Tax=Caulobacter phage CcrPW TaxID=2283271 RepID=A0A385EDK0_9CAUD|nr:hypothetical protein HOU00_gp193 [Caulobacter phage CcrPW]AXQ68932.1 hypothetical protein CcrPW_gp393c [Caulobacter phage CcrPW]